MRRFNESLMILLSMMKGEIPMVEVYTTLIIVGRKKFSSVPTQLKGAVKANLLALGLDENGNVIE